VRRRSTVFSSDGQPTYVHGYTGHQSPKRPPRKRPSFGLSFDDRDVLTERKTQLRTEASTTSFVNTHLAVATATTVAAATESTTGPPSEPVSAATEPTTASPSEPVSAESGAHIM
jgi:hypothetical protein